MKRRTFLKLTGLGVLVPGTTIKALVKTKSKKAHLYCISDIDIFREYQNSINLALLKQTSLSPVLKS